MADQMTQTQDTQYCIDACTECHQICQRMALTDYLQSGKQMEEETFRLLINCAEICQTAANFLISNSSQYGVICVACAEICDACAQSCEQVGGMEECVQACRYCAESCEDIAKLHQPSRGKDSSKNLPGMNA